MSVDACGVVGRLHVRDRLHRAENL